MSTPLLYETHMHTELCKHAEGHPDAYAKTALLRGLKGMIVTCHNPMPHGFAAWSRMDMNDFSTYVELVNLTKDNFKGQLDVRLGMECDFMPGYEQFVEDQLKWADFHYILGSVHPFLQEYIHAFGHTDSLNFQKGYFNHLVQAAETGLFDCLSHPDIVKVMFPKNWDIKPVFEHICNCLDRIAKTGIAMELNTSGLLKKYPEFNPGMEMLKEMQKRNIPVVIGADAHKPSRVGENFELAISTLKQAGYEKVSYFLNRQRQEVDLSDALNSLNATSAA